MKKTILKITLLTTTFLFFSASNIGARGNFNLNSITVSDIGRFDGHSPRHGTRHSLDFSEEFGDGGIFNFIRRKDKKEWTIMVYINAKNDLEEYGLKDINEMEMIGSSDKVNVVVEIGRMDGFDSSENDWTGAKRYFIQKDDNTSSITSPVLADLGKVDMGDWKHLVDFGVWAKALYPAEKYMLIVWNHGTGWEKNSKSGKNKGLSYDFETKNHFTTPELAKALKKIGKLDVYASDACLMQMASVGYEIKDNITYIVGSEAIEPKDGYIYNTLLEPIISNPEITPYRAAKVLVDAYSDYYQSISKKSTQSFIKTSELEKLIILMDDWACAAIQSKEKDLIIGCIYLTQKYFKLDNKDLYHFVSIVTAKTLTENLKKKGEVLMRHIKENAVAYSRYTDSSRTWWNYSNSRGIAVYLPISQYDSDYDELKIAQQSYWDEFIQWYLTSLSADKI